MYLSGGHPVPRGSASSCAAGDGEVSGLWLLMKTFASGCAAMTGVEAVSNGVMAFEEPRAETAQRTLTVIIVILIVLLFGIAWLSKAYRVTPMEPDAA